MERYIRNKVHLLENLNKGGILTYEMVRQAVVEGNTYTVQTSNNIEKALSFIGIWEQTIRELRTNDNGARFTTAESYEYSLKSFKKILGDETVKGFDVSAAEIQKWKDGMLFERRSLSIFKQEGERTCKYS